MNKLILNTIFLFTPLFRNYGVDVKQLRIILETKLMMDNRRPFSIGAKRQSTGKKSNNTSIGGFIILFFMGVFFAALLVKTRGSLIGNAVYISGFMFIIAVSLISDFTNVLVDVRYNLIILPRPVNDKTFAISRILHISIHVGKLVIGFTLPAIIAMVILDSSPGLFLIPEIILAAVFAIFLVNIVYLGVLKYSTPARFNTVITYVQVIFSIFIFAGSQLARPILDRIDQLGTNPLSHVWTWFLPPVWFASLYQTVIHPAKATGMQVILAVAAVICPIVAVLWVVKVLAPGFNRKLSSISANGDASPEPARTTQSEKRPAVKALVNTLAHGLSRNKVEQAGFKLTWILSGRYRDFKLKVYPSFAYVPVLIVSFLFTRVDRQTGEHMDLASLREGKWYIFLLYFCSFMIVSVLQVVSQSEKYKAAWIMFTTGHNEPGKILSGMFKAIIIKFYVPYYLLISAFSLWVWGPAVMNDLVMAFFNSLSYGVIMSLITIDYLPFSQPVTLKGGRFFARFFVFLFVGAFGGLHYLATYWEWLTNVCMLISIGIFWALFYYFGRRNWQALEADYS